MYDAPCSALSFLLCLTICSFQELWFKETTALKCPLVCSRCECRRAEARYHNHIRGKQVGIVNTENVQNDKNKIIHVNKIIHFLHLRKVVFYLEVRFDWENSFWPCQWFSIFLSHMWMEMLTEKIYLMGGTFSSVDV